MRAPSHPLSRSAGASVSVRSAYQILDGCQEIGSSQCIRAAAQHVAGGAVAAVVRSLRIKAREGERSTGSIDLELNRLSGELGRVLVADDLGHHCTHGAAHRLIAACRIFGRSPPLTHESGSLTEDTGCTPGFRGATCQA